MQGILEAIDPDAFTPQTNSSTCTARIATAKARLQALHSVPGFSPEVNLVCTLGALGVLALVPSLNVSANEAKILYMPAARLDGSVVDTTGAGDCFTGYFIAGLMEAYHDTCVRGLSKEIVMRVLKRAVEVRLTFISYQPLFITFVGRHRRLPACVFSELVRRRVSHRRPRWI